MRFLLDENIGKKVAYFLEGLGYTVYRVKQIESGIDDYKVLDLAVSRNLVLITSDKDFGELVFKESQPHSGVILLRLQNETSSNKIRILKRVFLERKDLKKNFIVVNEKQDGIKIRSKKSS